MHVQIPFRKPSFVPNPSVNYINDSATTHPYRSSISLLILGVTDFVYYARKWGWNPIYICNSLCESQVGDKWETLRYEREYEKELFRAFFGCE